MPLITLVADEADTRRFDSPEQHQIAASTCLIQCFYSIPPILITVALPGISIFVIGVVLITLALAADDPSSLAEGLSRNAVVVVAVGGGWTVMVIGFWTTTYCRRRHTTSSKSASSSRDHTSSVELVSVSRRDDA